MLTLLEANRSLGDDPQAGKYVQIAMLAVRASVLWQAKQPEQAKQQTERLLAESAQLLGPNHPIVAYMTMDQAVRMMEFGDFKSGELLLLKGIAKSRKKFGRQPRTAKGLYKYGYMLDWKGRKLDIAAKVLAESAEIYAEVLGRDNTLTEQSLAVYRKVMQRLGREGEIEPFLASLPN